MFLLCAEASFFTNATCLSLRSVAIAVEAVSLLELLHLVSFFTFLTVCNACYIQLNICCIHRPSVVLKERTTYLRLTGRLCTTWGWFTSQQNSMHLLFITSQLQSIWILHVQEPSCCWHVSLWVFIQKVKLGYHDTKCMNILDPPTVWSYHYWRLWTLCISYETGRLLKLNLTREETLNLWTVNHGSIVKLDL
jgi:hypothetical protein